MARQARYSCRRGLTLRIAGVLLSLYLLVVYFRGTRREQVVDEKQEIEKATLFGISPPARIPVLIFACNRADNLRLTIDSILTSNPSLSRHPIFISQDGDDAAVAEVIASYGELVTHLHYHWPGKPGKKTYTTYMHISGHYQYALTEVMEHVKGHEDWDRVIMLEDDMLISPDFFSYFQKMSPLLDIDPTLYCVSAWNENGQTQFVSSSTSVYRTDCFPGLGWMLSRAIWNELRDWAPAFWDDWMREPAQRKGRSCIYPEINRAYTFGKVGASHGQAFDLWLKDIRLNTEDVDWRAIDVDHLLHYDKWIMARLRASIRVGSVAEAKARIDAQLSGNIASRASEMLARYDDLEDLTETMETTGLMYAHKAGVARASYKGILQFRHRGVRIWLAPKALSVPLP